MLIEEFKVDIHELDFLARNCFMYAAAGGKHDTMRYLHSLDQRMCRCRDKNGWTALTLAMVCWYIFVHLRRIGD